MRLYNIITLCVSGIKVKWNQLNLKQRLFQGKHCFTVCRQTNMLKVTYGICKFHISDLSWVI